MPTPLTSLLDRDRIRVRLESTSKAVLLESMVHLVATHEAVRDPDRLLRDVKAREATMSTGVGEGLALPHARTLAVSETVAAFATLRSPVPFDALDGQPVHLVLLLAGPEADRAAHLHTLSWVSRILSDAGVRRHLSAAASADDVLAVLHDAEAAVA